MQILLGIYVFVIGLAFGSFALAMVDRMKAGKDWVRGRSECDHCKHKLKVIDLVPLFSWVSLKGKCRYCSKKLSSAYPLVEFATAVAFLASWLFLPYEIQGNGAILFSLWLASLVVMAGLVVFDLRWFILPNKLIYPLIGLASVHRLIYLFDSYNVLTRDLLNMMLSVLIGAGVFWILHAVSNGKWIGDGDIRLGVAMGLLLPGPIETWLAIFVASVAGVVISLPHLIKDKKALKMKIPFGPLLILGLIVSYLFGSQLIEWYNTTFLYL